MTDASKKQQQVVKEEKGKERSDTQWSIKSRTLPLKKRC